jgi:hypothetical protein
LSVDRSDRADVLAGYFRLQLMLVDAMIARTAAPLGETVLRMTNLHRRLGFGDVGAAPLSPGWEAYISGLATASTIEARVAWTKAVFARSPPEAPRPARFGCFAYDEPDADGVVRIHFGSYDSDDGVGPLARTKIERRVDELRRMFDAIRRSAPNARSVMGASWLYNLEAYRRLFPPEYAASRGRPPRVRLSGTSSWGQLIDHRGFVKPDVEAAFLRNLRDAFDPAAPWLLFPYPALTTSAPIEMFYAFYDAASPSDR